jgi:predicted NBD/HSP70 family sugar kinase
MYLLFDIGGTNTRIALTADLKTIHAVERFETPLGYADGIRALGQAAKRLAAGASIRAAAGGIRGPLNHEKTGIVSESKLTDWIGRSVVHDLSASLGVPVILENDTAIVGLGEVTFGAGQGCEIVAYHTVSTGVGGARFVHGRLDIVSSGFEPGHQVLDIDRTVLGRKEAPTLENLVSGTALEKRRGVKPYAIAQDDHIWDELARYLAYGLKNTVLYWSPDRIVLGGSMITGDPKIPLDRIVFHTKNLLEGLVPCPSIVTASLKDDGGLYGAMALLANKRANIL